jgi:hypothetical protein
VGDNHRPKSNEIEKEKERPHLMNPLTLVLPVDGTSEETLSAWRQHPLIDRLILLIGSNSEQEIPSAEAIHVDSIFSGKVINQILERWQSDYLLLVLPGGRVEWGSRAFERLIQVARDSSCGLAYTDYQEISGGEIKDHPLVEYQLGSIRDNFDFGGAILLSRRAVLNALQHYGRISDDLRWGGLYDLRLKLSLSERIVRLPESLYRREVLETRTSGERIFDYVSPTQRDFQIEMESIATEHLRRLGAYLKWDFKQVPETSAEYPNLASIIIPVRNRVGTIADAVRSALQQETDFPFNVIVIDNHSTDGTSEILHQLGSDNARLVHVTPERKDLGIGGCWNEAIFSRHCGRYAVQLDSDDLYSSDQTLKLIVEMFREGKYAMVIGSYTTVDFELHELPPGLIDHREWTRENGRNNALRINGLGAPRAFDVAILRQIGLPNVSYGEDYSVALRISREYEIGRIYDSLYLARRWGGNSDSALPLVTANRYDTYKDFIRTQEILARLEINRPQETGR